jgi:hypothetical protein
MPTSSEIKAFSVAIRIIASHGYNRPGFTSSRYGKFSSVVKNGEEYPDKFSANDLVVLNQKCEIFSIGQPTSGDEKLSWQELYVVFENALSPDDVSIFIEKLADALSIHFAKNQRDPWYGNNYVDIGWSSLQLTSLEKWNSTPEQLSSSFEFSASLSIKSVERIDLNTEIIETLQDSSYSAIFSEGMRAPQPKAKYINWFVLIEELEKQDEFKKLFTPMFSKADQTVILNATTGMPEMLKTRLNNFLTNPNLHTESRHEKLCKILHQIGITTLPTLSNIKIDVNVELCKRLIKERNLAAHRGSTIDENLLYNSLFPIAYGALQFLNKK